MLHFFRIATAFFLLLNSLALLAQSTEGCSHKASYYMNKQYSMTDKSGAVSFYDVHYYKLDLHVERNTTFIEGSVTIGAKVSGVSLDTFTCELHSNHTIDSVLVNGSKNIYIHSGNEVSIPLTTTFSTNAHITTQIFYHGTAPASGSSAIGNGLSTGTSMSWGNQATWSLSQPFSAYEWFPVKQVLQDKADSIEVWITTDAANMAGSNGVLNAVTNVSGGKKRYEWKSRYPTAYYLISLSVAKYVDYTIYAKPAGLTDSIKIVNFIYDNPATLPNFKTEIDKTALMINVFSEKFGLYPFHKEKYGHCMAPFSGGMEHQTMTTQGFFNTDLTSHELGHQWFGDDVTCASWKDIYLNEGFASYLEYVYIQEMEPARANDWIDDTHGNALVPTGSVYVDDTTDVSRIFSSSLTYNKGAFLLHMLRYEINNDSLFFVGMKNYSSKYGGKTANNQMFKAEMESTTGLNFTDFFNQWYYGEGYPMFNITYNSGGNQALLKIEQITSAPTVTPIFKTHLDVILFVSGFPNQKVRLFMDQSVQTFIIPNVGGKVVTLMVDPDQWILNEEGSITYDANLGVQAIGARPIRIYPNPTSGHVHIELEKTEASVALQICDLHGKEIERLNFQSTNVIDFDLNQPVGVYLIKLSLSDGKTFEYKLVKE